MPGRLQVFNSCIRDYSMESLSSILLKTEIFKEKLISSSSLLVVKVTSMKEDAFNEKMGKSLKILILRC
jgi:hypothetical protein